MATLACAGRNRAPVVWFGDKLVKKVPIRVVHMVSAAIFAVLGVAALIGWGS